MNSFAMETGDEAGNEAPQDLCQLTVLSTQDICRALRSRFASDQLYTWCGANTLVAVNPCRPVPHVYTEAYLNQCLAAACTESLQAKLAPHIYSLAAAAYHHLLTGPAGAGQTLIVSGVSGAGKTESSRHLLRFLSHASQAASPGGCRFYAGAPDAAAAASRSIEEVVEASNPLLECFGNAGTQENENSSRFGRHLELTFDRRGRLLGGRLRVLLLERGRALRPWPTTTTIEDPDRPFHALLTLASAECRAELLKDDDDNQQLVQRLPPPLSIASSDSTSHSWRSLAPLLSRFLPSTSGDKNDAPRQTARLLAGLLLLARLPIVSSSKCNDDDAPAEIPASSLADAQTAVCAGLGLPDAGRLLSALASARIESGRGSVFQRPCSARECAGRRDALCRLVYGRLFAYLVRRVNACIEPSREALDAAAATEGVATLGILDLYGFENFPGRNGLDQLLINYANERLQQFYLTHFVLAASQEYADERLPAPDDDDLASSSLKMTVAEAVVQTERVLTALEEQCRMNRPDWQLAERLGCCRRNAEFVVRHFAGRVAYSPTELPARNRDRCPPELIAALRETRSQLLLCILSDENADEDGAAVVIDADDQGRRKPSGVSGGGVSAKFRADLGRLLDRLRSTRPLWVRCLRPTLSKRNDVSDGTCRWSDTAVAGQLESCGLLSATRAARRLHPVRLPYADFLTRYGCLLSRPTVGIAFSPSASPTPAELDLAYRRQFDLPTTPSRTPERRLRRRTGASPVDHQRRLAANILAAGQSDAPPIRAGQQFGRGRLFLTAEQAAALDAQLAEYRRDCVVRLQRAVRVWLARRRRPRRLAEVQNIQLATDSACEGSGACSRKSLTLPCESPFYPKFTPGATPISRSPGVTPPSAVVIHPTVTPPSAMKTYASPTLPSAASQSGVVSRHRLCGASPMRRLSLSSRRQLFRGPIRADRLLPYARARGLAFARGLEDALEDDIE